MKKILILGGTGMLGSMCASYLSRCFDVSMTVRNQSPELQDKKIRVFSLITDENLKEQLRNIYQMFPYEYMLNCIGIIKPYCKDDDPLGVKLAISINALFPHQLAHSVLEINKSIKIIQIATDCVFSGDRGFYTENDYHDAKDVYGKTKSLGEVFTANSLNIRCSIIGPEKKNKISLLEWFLNNPVKSTIDGYENHMWNGVTTLQFAQYVENLIKMDMFSLLKKRNKTIHFVPNEAITKYQLLCLFRDIFKHNIQILPSTLKSPPVNRTLSTIYDHSKLKKMGAAIEELYIYINSGQY